MAEIVRAGILSVDEGQTEAASALGMTRMQTLRRIVLPQAMRVIVPPTGNETISMLKTTSLVAYVPYVGAALPDQRDRQPHVPADPAADRRQPLVPGADHACSWSASTTSSATTRAAIGRATLPPTAAAARRCGDAPDRTTSRDEHADDHADGARPSSVHKCFGRLEVLKGIDLEVAPARGHVHRRAVRLGQVDLPALHQPPRDASTPGGCRSTASWSATARRAASSTSCTTRRWPASAGTSAWCSSGSTSSRT